MGDLLREEARKNTPLGNRIRERMVSGKMIKDGDSFDVIRKRLSRQKNDFVLDGFPRYMRQALFLSKALNHLNQSVSLAVELLVSDALCVKRLSSRWQCKGCHAIYNTVSLKPKKKGFCDRCHGKLFRRDDDNPRAIRERLKEFRNETIPVIRFYQTQGLLFRLDASKANPARLAQFVLRELKKRHSALTEH